MDDTKNTCKNHHSNLLKILHFTQCPEYELAIFLQYWGKNSVGRDEIAFVLRPKSLWSTKSRSNLRKRKGRLDICCSWMLLIYMAKCQNQHHFTEFWQRNVFTARISGVPVQEKREVGFYKHWPNYLLTSSDHDKQVSTQSIILMANWQHNFNS